MKNKSKKREMYTNLLIKNLEDLELIIIDEIKIKQRRMENYTQRIEILEHL